MDITFSTTPPILTRISPISFHSTSSAPFLSVARVRSIRRDFLGSSFSSRPPGVRIRRRGWRYGVAPTRLVVTNGLSPDKVFLAVAVVSVSVAAVAIFDSMKKKKVDKVKSDSDSPSSQPRHDSRGGNGVHEELVLGSKVVETSLENDIENLEEKRKVKAHVSKVEESTLEPEVVTSIHEETHLTGTSEDSNSFSDVGIDDSVHRQESETTPFPVVLPVISDEVYHYPVSSTVESFNGHVERHLDGGDMESGSSYVTLSSFSTEEDSRKLTGSVTDVGRNADVTPDSGFLRSSPKADLYTMFDKNKLNLNGVSRSEGVVSMPLNGYSPINNSSPTAEAMVPTKFKPSANGASHITELEIDSASLNKSPHRRKKVNKQEKGFARAKAKGLLTFTNGAHVNNIDDPSDIDSAYQRLLRTGRLKDCLLLLEDLEKKNLLDMDKVYHSRFLQTCKTQKSVKEAFRFVNMIPNPTMSTFNMLMSVCARSQDLDGAFQVLRLVQGSGQKADCKLYTTLISTCAKCGKVDRMFEVFHKMVNAKVEPNQHTYGALIDGCARAGQVPKAFGAYGIMRSKNVKPDLAVFNALITACGQSGAVDRAFDVLAEMRAENIPVDPDHVTVGALIKACVNGGQFDRAREVYKMLDTYKIKGNPEVYTIAVNSCSQSGDWEFACSVYNDMKDKGIIPDEMFLSALIDVAGHAGKIDAAFEVIKDAQTLSINLGIISYSSLMGACCNAKCWQKALEVYQVIKSQKLKPTVATMNALITALCDGDQLQKAMEIFNDMMVLGLCPNSITYAILSVASERGDDLDAGLELLSQAQKDKIVPNLAMFRGLIGMCLRRYEKACSVGEPVMSSYSGTPQIDNKWTVLALKIYRETIVAWSKPTADIVSKVLGCLQLPHDASLRNRLIENLGVSSESVKSSKLCSLVDGFGEYDPRAFSLYEEAAYLGVVPSVSLKSSPIVVDARNLQIHSVEVYLLTVLKGLKHRLAAGARLPNINILLPIEKAPVQVSKREKTINMATRVSQKVAALLRRLRLPYQGNESFGKIRIYGIATKRWLQPRLAIASPFNGQPTNLSLSEVVLGKKITDKQRDIRSGNLSL